jgi:hypothetical protein
MPNVTPITPPRVPLVDPRTGFIDRAWYLFFLSLNNAAAEVYDNPAVAPDVVSLTASYDAELQALSQAVDTQPPQTDASELTKQIDAAGLFDCSSSLLSQIAELQKQIDALNMKPPPPEIVTSSGGVTSVTATAPVASTGGTTPDISMAAASSSTNGYLTSTDWNTFNNKQPIAAPATYTANFSVAATDVWIINNKSGSSCTATLPAASGYSGRVLHFQNYQSQTLISASSNVVAIGGGAAGTSILLASAGDQCTLVSNGTNWIMMQYVPNNILLLE